MGALGIPLSTVFLIFLQATGVYLLNASNSSDSCESEKNCGDCIRNPDICVWCAMDNFHGSRCMKADKYAQIPKNCAKLLQNPENRLTIGFNMNFSSEIDKFTQVRPQTYKMDLRIQKPINFTFSFSPASDYPVDLYILMDTSKTMQNVKNQIQNQSQIIYDTMRELTKNIQMGIGVFIDKNALPFANKTNAERTYSFHNSLKLTSDSSLFEQTLREIKYGTNQDQPEGGLDALAQVLKCKKQIGWRNESRKIVVLLTDAPYHVAGDGIIGGIFTPYDGGCYTNEIGHYTNELSMDYPSVSMINKLATDEEITILFVVKNEVKNVYSHLSQAISGSQCESYDSGNDNIAKILTEKYKEITREIKLKAHFKSGSKDKFDITFDPDCTGDSENNEKCAVRQGEEIKITGTLKLLKDPGIDNTTIDILIEGINEKLTLDVNFLRHCVCESTPFYNSSLCSDGGTLKCGICECNNDRYGEKCACKASSMSRINDNSTCIMPGHEDVCNGRGVCVCGKCYCGTDTPYEGPFCQFNKDNCPRFNYTVCNGRGVCFNEQCKCTDPEWEGDACECSKSTSACKRNGKVCNNMGKCLCGKCVCTPTAAWDARDKDDFCFSLPCTDCHMPQCDRLYSCAQCLLSKERCTECQPFNVTLSEFPVSAENATWKVCADISTKVGCYTRFMYRYSEDENSIELVVQAKEDCLQSYYMYGGACLGTLILIGVATLAAWKLLTYTRDRQEYERFLKQHAADETQVCTNPTFVAASTTITNPAFRRPSVDHRN